MANTISLEYLESLFNASDGIAQLDTNGKLPDNILPDSALGAFLGDYAGTDALIAAHPTASYGQYATISGEIYYYNAAMTPPAWTPVTIAITAYRALTEAELAGQPQWIIVPDPVADP